MERPYGFKILFPLSYFISTCPPSVRSCLSIRMATRLRLSYPERRISGSINQTQTPTDTTTSTTDNRIITRFAKGYALLVEPQKEVSSKAHASYRKGWLWFCLYCPSQRFVVCHTGLASSETGKCRRDT